MSNNTTYSRVWTALRKIGMEDRATVVPARFGYEFIEVSCSNRFEREAVEKASHIKGVFTEAFFPGIHDSIGVVKIHDAKRYSECRKKIDAEMERIEDWWQRYHSADEETQKLMACGKIS